MLFNTLNTLSRWNHRSIIWALSATTIFLSKYCDITKIDLWSHANARWRHIRRVFLQVQIDAKLVFTGEYRFPAKRARIVGSCEWYTHIFQVCFTGTGAIKKKFCSGEWNTVETLYKTINFCWSTHKRHSIARPKGRGMGCLLWVQRTTYCVDLSKLSSIKYLL